MRPSAARPRTSVRTQRIPSASSPLSGSSKSSVRGSPSSAAAIPSRCSMPSEKPRDALARDRRETDLVEHLGDPGAREPAGVGQPAQVGAGGPLAVHGLGVQQRADLAHRRRRIAIRAAADRHRPGGRAIQPEDEAQRGGLAGAVRAQEAVDHARNHLERQVVDGDRVAVALAQPARLDHRRRHTSAITAQPMISASRMSLPLTTISFAQPGTSGTSGGPISGSSMSRWAANSAAAKTRKPASLSGGVAALGHEQHGRCAQRPAHRARAWSFPSVFRRSGAARDRRRRRTRRPGRGRAARACAAPRTRAS